MELLVVHCLLFEVLFDSCVYLSYALWLEKVLYFLMFCRYYVPLMAFLWTYKLYVFIRFILHTLSPCLDLF